MLHISHYWQTAQHFPTLLKVLINNKRGCLDYINSGITGQYSLMIEVATVLLVTRQSEPQDVVGQYKTETLLDSHFQIWGLPTGT